MPYCPHCGQEVDQNASKCFLCGEDIPKEGAQTAYDPGRPGQERPEDPSGQAQTPPRQGRATGDSEISRDEWLAYVGKKASYYFPRFAKFTKTGADRFAVTWNWPALFVPFWWFIYRKMYIYAGAIAILAFVPYVNLVLWLVSALCVNFIYYKDAKRKILAIKRAYPGQDVTGLLAKAGGVHSWVPWVAIVVSVLIMAFLLLGALSGEAEFPAGPMPESAEPISS